MRKLIELLAPAGTPEALVAAVENGADAVYLGGALFSARASAGNFTREQLGDVVDYAHQRDVRVFITVNTLVKDGEMDALVDWLAFLESLGVDAVIVQDLGVLDILHQWFPGLEIHSSTQMTVNNRAGIRFLERFGVDRVVLARENTLEEIRILAQTGMDLEVFIHGAICVCYSGQCLMSSMIGGRSGNRGRCAQPCRMTYDLVDGEGKDWGRAGSEGHHLLSPKDLNTIDLMKEMMEAGAMSLKIEGRMKRPEYVATVVRNYRERLDWILAGGPRPDEEEQNRQLAQAFSREFTTGYFLPEPVRDRMSARRPNNRGVLLGRIDNWTPRGFLIRVNTPLALGDGLEIWVSKGGRKALTVTRMLVEGKPADQARVGEQVEIFFSEKTYPGDRIFKTHDALLVERARETYREISAEPSRALHIQVSGSLGEPLKMEIRDDEGNRRSAFSSQPLEEARNRPLTEDVALSKMRLGGTGYRLGSFAFQVDDGLMLPLSALNALRRELVDELEATRREGLTLPRTVVLPHIPVQGTRKWLRLSVEVDTEEDGQVALDGGADRVYIHLRPFRGRKEKNSSLRKRSGQEIYYVIPRILKEQQTEELLRQMEKKAPRADGFCAGSLGGLQLIREWDGSPTGLAGDWSLNVMNSQSADFLTREGLKTVCLSPELTFGEMGEMGGACFEALAHGNLPLMVTDYCMAEQYGGPEGSCGPPGCKMPCMTDPLYLKDRYDYLFPLRFDEACQMHVYNSRELCLVEDLDRMMASGVSMVRLLLRERSAREIREITGIYRRLLDLPDRRAGDLEKAGKELAALSPYGFTKGHYYRGVD